VIVYVLKHRYTHPSQSDILLYGTAYLDYIFYDVGVSLDWFR